MLAVGRPDRVTRDGKVILKLSWRRAARRRNQVDLSGVELLLPDPIGDQGAIGREARPSAILGQQARLASQGRHQVNAAAVALGAECDFGVIGRKSWLGVVE